MNSLIKMHNNRPTIFIDDIPMCPVIYALTDCPGSRLSFEEVPNFNINKFIKAGIKMVQLDIWLADMWFEDGSFDISFAKKQIDGVTKLDKNVAVFFRFHTTPPTWWHEKYEEECVQFADTPATKEKELPYIDRYLIQDQDPVLRHSFASKKWLDDASKMLIRFIEEFQKCAQSTNLVGIQVATGLYGENHYWAFMKHEPDTSLPMTKSFRQFVGDNQANVPTMDERFFPQDGIFRNPKSESNYINYCTCQHESVAKSIVHFCKIIKDNWKGEIITGAFYCYYVSLFGRAATGGHLAEEIVLSSPYIDYISAPQAYNHNLRNIGGAGVSRGLLESIKIHDKLLLDEVDHPTHTGTIMAGMKTYPKYESHQILRRNILSSYLSGMGFWYYDFGPYNNSGWWNDPLYMDEIIYLQQLMEDKYKLAYKKNADVLLVFDSKVFKYMANNEQQDPITDKACVNISYPMALRSGASIDTIYLSDMGNINLDKYKCIVFMNTFYLTDEQKQFIKSNVYKNKRSIVWFVAPGYTDGKQNELSFVENITEFMLKKEKVTDNITIKTNDYSYSLDNSHEKTLLEELIVPTDGISLVSDTSFKGFSKKEFDDYTTYFSSIPFTTPEAFRHVFINSGAHIYNHHNDSLLEGSGLLLLHCEYGGERIIYVANKEIKLMINDSETIIIDSITGCILRRG